MEADALDAVPVLRKYMTEIRVTRPYFDASPDSHDDDVVRRDGPADRRYRRARRQHHADV